MAEDGADMDGLMKRMDVLQTEIDAANGWELERQLERATEALRCPPGLFTPCANRSCIAYPCITGAGPPVGARDSGIALHARFGCSKTPLKPFYMQDTRTVPNV